jgi:hypothetical protein
MDGAFFHQTKTGGWGFIIRENEDDNVGSDADHTEAVSEKVHAKAYACLHVVQHAIDADIYKVELETECLTLKTALSRDAYDAAEGGTLFREIKYLLAVNFADFKVIHRSRTCNKVAHKLTSMSSNLGEAE